MMIVLMKVMVMISEFDLSNLFGSLNPRIVGSEMLIMHGDKSWKV